MMLITTSRKPSRNTRVFARTLSNLLPNSVYVPRGKGSVESMVEGASAKGLKRVAVVHDSKGNPGKISLIENRKDGWDWAEEIPIAGIVLTKPVKKQYTEASCEDRKLAEVLAVEPVEDAELSLVKRPGAIEFVSGKEKLLVIKTGGK